MIPSEPYTYGFLEGTQPTISKADHRLAIIVFTTIGTVAVYPWNAMLNVLYDLSAYTYDDAAVADTVILTYEAFAIFVTATLVVIGGVRPRLLLTCCIVVAVSTLALPFIPQYFPGITGKILLHLITVPFGISAGVMTAVGASVASIFDFNYGGYFAFGIGVSGICSFTLWMIADKLLFVRPDRTTSEAQQMLTNSTWLLFAVGCTIALIATVAFYTLMRRSWFRYTVERYWKEAAKTNYAATCEMQEVPEAVKSSSALEGELLDAEAAPRRFWLILKDCWVQLFNVALTLWITLLLFPEIGPFGWKGNNLQDVNVGIFQVGDFIGRYVPNLGGFFQLEKPTLLVVSLSRLAFVAIYPLGMIYTNTVFNAFWMQALLMAIISLSNGAVVTQALIFAPDCVPRIKEKGKVGAYSSLAMQVGVAVGLYCSKAYKTVLETFI